MARRPLPWKQKKPFPWKLLTLLIVGGAVVAVLAGILCTWGTGTDMRRALAAGRLANPPTSASQLKDGSIRSDSGTTYFVKFAVRQEAIYRFIQGSDGLRELTPEPLGPERMYLPRSAASSAASQPGQHIFFEPNERYSWFDPTVRTKGRRFVIPADAEGNHGEVVIDDETDVVYIMVSQGQRGR